MISCFTRPLPRVPRLVRCASQLTPTIKTLLARQDADSVRVCGWIKSVRRQKNIVFAVVSDGTSEKGLQAVFSRPVFDSIPGLMTTGSSVRLTGRIVESGGSEQAKELRVESGRILGSCDAKEYPIQKQELTTEFLRHLTHWRARTDATAKMLRLRDVLTRSARKYLAKNNFLHVDTPILTLNDCENNGETFQAVVDDVEPTSLENPTTPTPSEGNTQLKGSTTPTLRQDDAEPNSLKNATTAAPPAKRLVSPHPTSTAHLTVSHQLHLEAICASFARAYSLAPCFRAERSATSRHLNEFWMLEAELSFLEASDKGLEQLMDAAEELVRHMVETGASSVRGPEGDAALGAPWPRITYARAIEALREAQTRVPTQPLFAYEPAHGEPIRTEHERWLAEHFVHGPLFVTHYPRALKPFYMRASDGEATAGAGAQTAACFDLLVPGVGELAGGSMREERLEHLELAMAERGMNEGGELQWYVDLRRYGSVPHGGFGLGIERMVAWLLGGENVRDCVAFPRWAGNWML